MSDLQTATVGLVGAVFEASTSSQAAASDCANAMFEVVVPFGKAADDGAAATNTVELVLAKLPRRAKLVDATFTPSGATGLVAVAANFAQIIFQARNGSGGSALSLGTTNTTPTANGGTGNFAQWNTVPLTVAPFDPTNAVIPAGGVLTLQILKVGAGVVFPLGNFTARLQYL